MLAATTTVFSARSDIQIAIAGVLPTLGYSIPRTDEVEEELIIDDNPAQLHYYQHRRR